MNDGLNPLNDVYPLTFPVPVTSRANCNLAAWQYDYRVLVWLFALYGSDQQIQASTACKSCPARLCLCHLYLENMSWKKVEQKKDKTRAMLKYMRLMACSRMCGGCGFTWHEVCVHAVAHTPRLGIVLLGLQPCLDQIQRLEEQRRAGAAERATHKGFERWVSLKTMTDREGQ